MAYFTRTVMKLGQCIYSSVTHKATQSTRYISSITRSICGSTVKNNCLLNNAKTYTNKAPCTISIFYPSRQFHSDGDKDLVKFLGEEISFEEENAKPTNVPETLKNFNMSMDGTVVTLRRNLKGEEVEVVFNCNDSINIDGSETSGEYNDANPEDEDISDIVTDIKNKMELKQPCARGIDTDGKNSTSYMDRVAEAQHTDDLKWIVFRRGDILRFLDQHAPSKTKKSDGVGWISVINDEVHVKRESGNSKLNSDSDSLELMIEEWNSLGLERTADDCHTLAKKYTKTCGKWMIFPHTSRVDNLWGLIAIGIASGMLPTCCSAKVSASGGRHVICVHNNNYLDLDEVNQVAKELRQIGIRGQLQYKPDVFTYLEVYRNNPWHIRPTLYVNKISLPLWSKGTDTWSQ